MNNPAQMPQNLLKSFAAALRARRTQMNMSQRDLARRVGISSKSLCNLEMGNNWPSMPVYVALIRVMKPKKRLPFIP